jgi:hypothetical protein
MARPDKSEYAPYYERYVSIVENDDIIDTLGSQPTRLQDLFTAMPDDRGEYRYADGKWSIKEVLSHLIDGERMFSYRLFRISRGDETPIEGFEQDDYIESAHANERSFGELLEEFNLLRRANMLLVNRLTDDAWSRRGTASNVAVSARALVYMMAGHVEHHLTILKERYAV